MKYITHKPTLKDITIWFLVLAIIVIIPVFSSYLLEPENPVLFIVPILILGFFIFNLVIRRSLFLKNYFSSPFNLLTSKVRSEKAFDIPKELMFEKMIEVIDHSKFKLVEADKDRLEILAITNITLKSWGENLYVSFETNGDETIMKFCSVTFFQITSWGTNEKNYEDLLSEIESSFTI
jgi:hypothetical protein